MEDSSNPYIPQEADAIRQKVQQAQSPLGGVVKWSLIATAVVTVLFGIGLYFISPLTSAVDQVARQKLADTLQPPEETLKRVSVQSQLGFRLNYDNRLFSSYAEEGDKTAGSDASAAVLSGQTYENNDLRVTRAYNYVRIRPLQSVEGARALATLPPELEMFATVSDADIVKAGKIPENKELSKLSLFVKIDGDKRLAERVTDNNTFVKIEATKPVNATIGGTEYQKVRYTTTNENYRIKNVKYDDCFYTIQFNQPYTICVSNVRPNNVSAASLIEQVFETITFESPQIQNTVITPTEDVTEPGSKKDVSYVYPLARLAQATTTVEDMSSDEGQSALLTLTPQYYSDAATLSAVASNQPSVVRVASLYCADLKMKFEDGETATTLSDACVGNVSSGVFISSDGYIATTGHAIRTQKRAAINGYINFATDREKMLDRLQRVLDYLLKAKIILQSDADYLKTGASVGDQDALAKIENIGSLIKDNYITPTDEEYTYAIQPTDRPIVVNYTDSLKPAFAYSDSVLKAKYIASNYDAEKAVQETFGSDTPKSDVGLLKVDGSFPEVSIASNEDTKANDILSTIGFTSYTNTTLTTDKLRNMPIATVSKVDQAYKDGETRLIQTDTAVLPGNDGAPVYNKSGQLMGFAVYGLSYCPDQSCFGNGTIRSSSELLTLLKENNISLSSGNESGAQWRSGVEQYIRANYAASTSAFATAGGEYRFNRWADPLKQLSSGLEGSEKDTSIMNQLQSFMIIAIVVLVIITVILAVAYVLHRKRISLLQVGHYGAASAPPTPPISPQNPQQPPVQQSSQQQTQSPPTQPAPTENKPEDPFYK